MNSSVLRGPRQLLWAVFLSGLLLPATDIQGSPDNLAFSLECPPDVTISCEDDLYDLDKYGKAYVHDYNGRRPAGKAKVVRDLNKCGKGTITRTWTVEDYQWNIHRCTQTIYVSGGGLDEDDIIWPKDYELEGCHPITDPKRFPVEYSVPRYRSYDCAQPMASYKDEVFEFSKACKKVIRIWTVIDWCEYSPNKRPLPGYFTHYQIIKVSAAEKPVIECPKDSVYEARKSCDSTLVQIDSVKAYTPCDSNLTITNNSPYAFENGPDASGVYPAGTTEVTFKIEYGCGKDTTCKVKITVDPKKGPVPYCRDGVITTLMGVDLDGDGIFDDGMVDVWAKDLDIGSYHPCGYKNLTFSFEADSVVMSRTFTCADLGKNEVRMYVTDEYGNQSYCRTYITIQNNNVNIPDCDPDTTGGGGTIKPVITWSAIQGTVMTDQGRAVPGTEIKLTAFGQDTILQSFTDTTISARLDTIVLSGGGTRVEIRIDTQIVIRFDTSFADKKVVRVSSDQGRWNLDKWINGKKYSIAASKEGNVREGLDILDALFLIQHLIGAATLENPYRYLAADVNGDKVVNYTDFEILYNLVMGVQNEFPGKANWMFVPAHHTFSNPADPWATPISDGVEIDPLTKDELIDLVGIKIGDLNGTIRPQLTQTVTQQRMDQRWFFDLEDQNVAKGQQVSISLDLSSLTVGNITWDLTSAGLAYSTHDFGRAVSAIDRLSVINDRLLLSFAGQDRITIRFTAERDIRISEVLNSSLVQGVLYTDSHVPYNPDFRFTVVQDQLEARVFPNPFRDEATIRITSGKQSGATLTIYDVTGRSFMTRQLWLSAGDNNVTVKAEDLPGRGFYIYEIVREGQKTIGKLQLSE